MSKKFYIIRGIIESHIDGLFSRYVAYINHPEFKEDLYETSYDDKTAKSFLKEETEKAIRLGLHYQKMEINIITTGSDVIIMLWESEPKTWVYEITESGRSRGSTILSCNSKEEALEHVKIHANQSYGGIKDVATIKLY